MSEDPRNLDNPNLRPLVEYHMREHWTLAKVAALTTEQIEAQLLAYGAALRGAAVRGTGAWPRIGVVDWPELGTHRPRDVPR